MPGWALSTAAAAVVLLLAVGGLISWSGLVGGANSGSSDGDSPATALPVAVARMTAVFRPGDLTDAEWEDFSSLVGRYDSAIGYLPVDQTTAHQQAVALFADDANALAVLNSYPDIASAYAQVDFAKTEDAYAFQEAAGSADYIVAIMGANGPRLARGYATSPELPISDDDARGAFWAYAYQSNLPATIETAALTTTTAPATTTTVVSPDDRTLSDADPEWVSAATAAGAIPARDDDLARAGLDMGEFVHGSGFKFPSTTQASPAVDEMGIVMYLSKDSPDSDQTWTCINDFARVGEEVIAGGGECTTKEVSRMLSFGFSGSGSCMPSPEVAPTLLSLWGLPDEATEVSIVVGDNETRIVPVSTSGTAQVVITGQVPVWSITFQGMTDEHQAELDRFLPANLEIESVCGDATGG